MRLISGSDTAEEEGENDVEEAVIRPPPAPSTSTTRTSTSRYGDASYPSKYYYRTPQGDVIKLSRKGATPAIPLVSPSLARAVGLIRPGWCALVVGGPWPSGYGGRLECDGSRVRFSIGRLW